MQVKDYAYVAMAAALFAVLIVPLRNSVVDDTFIHLQYARNLADRGELAFNRGEPTYGATSPLWVALLASARKAGANILVWCRVLSWLFAIVSLALVYRLAARLGAGTPACIAASFIVAAEAWFLRWSAVGMETSFAVFTVLLVFYSAIEARESLRSSVALGFSLLAASLVRPESTMLVPIVTLAFLLCPGAKKRHFAFLSIFLPLFAVWLLLVEHHTGSFVPLTAGAKHGHPAISAMILARASVPVRIFGATVAASWAVLALGIALSALFDRSLGSAFEKGRKIREMPVILSMLLWVVALPAAYVIVDFQIISRYLVPVIVPAVVLSCIACIRLAKRISSSVRVRDLILAAVAAASMVQSAAVYAKVVVPSTRAFSRALTRTVAGIGKKIDRIAPAKALVATPDIGVIGWYSNRRVLDLGGLVSPEMNRMRRFYDVEEIIERGLYLKFHPDYLVDRSSIPDRFEGAKIKGFSFTPIARGTVPNLGIRKPEPVYYVLYRLDRK